METVGEEVAVLARFEGGRLVPLRFRWEGRTYVVGRVTSAWSVREGAHRNRHFSVVANTGSFYEISFRPAGMRWVLEKRGLEG
ncbi:MAG: DUF6504 family protein [bacterium]